MPKNIGKGGKSFKAGNTKGNMQHSKRDIIYADPEFLEEYALVKEALGNLHLRLQLPGGGTVTGCIRGSMVRKVWIGVGDVVLISRRDFSKTDSVDIIHRYNPPEVRQLTKEGLISRDFQGSETENHSQYIFVNEDDAADDSEKTNTVDRYEVQLNDPLEQLEDL